MTWYLFTKAQRGCIWSFAAPYWLLLGIFAGVFEIVPMIGPLLAGAVAIGVGFTVSWHVALAAGAASRERVVGGAVERSRPTSASAPSADGLNLRRVVQAF